MKTKIIIFLILIVLFTIFVTQNTQPVDINVFLWKFSSPGIVLIVITAAVGIIIGLILASIFHPSKKKNLKEAVPHLDNNDIKDDMYKEKI
jgi:uncharacterized integral membrane protein